MIRPVSRQRLTLDNIMPAAFELSETMSVSAIVTTLKSRILHQRNHSQPNDETEILLRVAQQTVPAALNIMKRSRRTFWQMVSSCCRSKRTEQNPPAIV